jgi:AP-3 complex subunit beta
LVLGSDAGLGSQGARGYESVPEWVRDGEEPDPRLRDEGGVSTTTVGTSRAVTAGGQRMEGGGEAAKAMTGRKANGVQHKTLDDWLDEDDGAQAGVDEATESEDDEDDEEESSEYEEVTDSEEEIDEGSEGDEGEHERLVP